MPDPFISSDAASVEFERETLKISARGTRKEQLEGIRDYITSQLEGNLCSTCLNSRLRTGDQASLILRLQSVLAELDALPSGEETNRLDRIRGHLGIVGSSDSKQAVDTPDPSEQRRTGSRRPGGGRWAEA